MHTREEPPIYQGNVSCCAFKGITPYILGNASCCACKGIASYILGKHFILGIQGKSLLYTMETPHAVHTRNSPLYTRETLHAGHTREKPSIYQGNTSCCAFKGIAPYILGKHLMLCIQGKRPLYTRETPHAVHTREKPSIY